MMSIKQWFALVCFFLGYILFGATIFYIIEGKEEAQRLAEEKKLVHEVEDLIKQYYVPEGESTQKELFQKISEYCEKPLGGGVPHAASKLTWSFYHSIFFVLTIISTIGYGNLSLTTPFTRVFVIIYGLVGIPINGIVVFTLGEFFGKTFYKLYKRWKYGKVQRGLATLGLIGEIIVYAIPGFTVLILIPSLIITLYEGWTFDLAIEFAFATLTTIGVGHLVPGISENNHGQFLFTIYKAFLLIWIIIGLGYLAMVFSFISRGLRSKRMHKIEHKIARNIKKTNRRLRQELRSLLNEYLLMRVTPIYRERRVNAPMKVLRTQSCPDLRFGIYAECCKVKKRCFSEMPQPSSDMFIRRQSDTDLQNIDKEKTFMTNNNEQEHNQLLLRVVNALSNYNTMACSTVTGTEETDDTYYDLESDRFEMHLPYEHRKFSMMPVEPMRPRAASESVKEKAAVTFNTPWAQRSAARRVQEMREREKYGKTRSRTLPPIEKADNIFAKIKKTFTHNETDKKLIPNDIESQISKPREHDVEPQLSECRAADRNQLLEETSLADFLRALTIINFRDVSKPNRKFGNTDTSSIQRQRRMPITPVLTDRKTSLVQLSPIQETKHRRFSLNPEIPPSNDSVNSRVASPVPFNGTIATSSSRSGHNDKVNTTSTSPQCDFRHRLKSLSKFIDQKNQKRD